MWSEISAKSKRDLLLKYDEGAAYCTSMKSLFYLFILLFLLLIKISFNWISLRY